MDYNIIESKETISLERLLYIMICDDEKKRAKLYSKDKIMDKVEDLNSDFNDLYYDREEYHNEVIYEVGVQDGIAKGIQEKV